MLKIVVLSKKGNQYLKILSNNIEFPDVKDATKDGLLAIGGDLKPERLILAYKSGIFPWFDNDKFIMWWSPDPRFVLFPDKLKISKSMKRVLRSKDFDVTLNQAFELVITECSKVKRPGQSGTWLTENMIEAYSNLYKQGYIKSVEVWQKDKLVGGLYGVDVGNKIFCGESMFSKVNNASKLALIKFIELSDYKLIDCQVYTSHLKSLGAEEISRESFIKALN